MKDYTMIKNHDVTQKTTTKKNRVYVIFPEKPKNVCRKKNAVRHRRTHSFVVELLMKTKTTRQNPAKFKMNIEHNQKKKPV